MLRPIDNFFLQKDEPVKSCLLYLREIIPSLNKGITEEWKYSLPFYYYKGKMFCYLWIHKKYSCPYIGIVKGNQIDHPDLLQEKRAKMKILLIDPSKKIPVKKIKQILRLTLTLYK